MKNILALLILIASTAAAAPTTGGPVFADFINKKRITVDWVDVVNPYMTGAEKKTMMENVIAELRLHGIRVVLGKRLKVSDPFSEERSNITNSDDRFDQEFFYWRDRLFNRKQKRHVMYVIAPPWQQGGLLDEIGWPTGGKLTFSGRAGSNIRRGCIAYGSAAAFNTGGKPRLAESALTAEHEILHCLGASHQDSTANVMHSAAAAFIGMFGGVLPILPETLVELVHSLR